VQPPRPGKDPPSVLVQRPALILLACVLALAAIEGFAWWWMNPATADPAQPVLHYKPAGLDLRPHPLGHPANPVDLRPDPPEASLDLHPAPSTRTLLPELYRQAAPMLRCSDGEVIHVTREDGVSLYLAWFEWNDSDTGSVLEAFRHMPEACMGSIGMRLVEKAPARTYVVRGQESGDRSQETEVRGQEEAPAPSTSSTDHRSLITDHSPTPSSPNIQSPISNIQSPISNIHLHFDHTVFRDPGQGGGPLVPAPPVHAFRAVWISGNPAADARSGLDGRGFDQLRTIRLNSALTRYRPSHARVIQAAVRGAFNADAAWAAFEQSMLRDLTFRR
jgi:hypothetical protein